MVQIIYYKEPIRVDSIGKVFGLCVVPSEYSSLVLISTLYVIFIHKFISVATGNWVPHLSSSGSRLWVCSDAGNESSQCLPKILFINKKYKKIEFEKYLEKDLESTICDIYFQIFEENYRIL